MKKCLTCQKNFNSSDWKCPHCSFEPSISGHFPSFAPELFSRTPGYSEDYLDILGPAEESYFWFRSRKQLILWALGKYFPKAGSFYEIGCGTGFILSGVEEKYPQMELYGSEIYESALPKAEKRLKKVSLFQLDARKMPFSEAFDVIGAFDVLEHIPEDVAVLEQMGQALHKGGGILISVPQHQFLWSDWDELAFHVRRYEAKELKDKIEKAGFQVVFSSSFVSFLLPILAISRWLSKGKIKKNSEIKNELEINPILNFSLEKVLALERLLIKMGVRFPWGGSLFIAARKV